MSTMQELFPQENFEMGVRNNFLSSFQRQILNLSEDETYLLVYVIKYWKQSR